MAYDFNPYSAGNKVYGFGRSNPTSGPVNKAGYKQREKSAILRRNALLRRLKAQQQGNYMSPDWLRKGRKI